MECYFVSSLNEQAPGSRVPSPPDPQVEPEDEALHLP